MRYKVTLTTEDGEVLEQWKVCGTQADRLDDELNMSKMFARATLIAELAENIERADQRALKGTL
jgi:hypothetical protein